MKEEFLRMNRMRPLCMFFLIMTGYILLAYLIFPAENNICKVPDYYLVLSVSTSGAFVALYERWQKRRKPKHLPYQRRTVGARRKRSHYYRASLYLYDTEAVGSQLHTRCGAYGSA